MKTTPLLVLVQGLVEKSLLAVARLLPPKFVQSLVHELPIRLGFEGRRLDIRHWQQQLMQCVRVRQTGNNVKQY